MERSPCNCLSLDIRPNPCNVSIVLLTCLTILFLLIGGCHSAQSQAEHPHTLAGNSHLPEGVLKRTFTNERWDRIKDRPYDGYVIIRGNLDADGLLSMGQVVEKYPDGSRNEMARALSRNIRFDPVDVGSNIHPSAEIYVVFYEDKLPRVAYVFGKQLQTVGPTNLSDFKPSVYTRIY